MIALKPIKRKHLPKRVTVRFAEIEPGTEEFHLRRMLTAAQFLYDLGTSATAEPAQVTR